MGSGQLRDAAVGVKWPARREAAEPYEDEGAAQGALRSCEHARALPVEAPTLSRKFRYYVRFWVHNLVVGRIPRILVADDSAADRAALRSLLTGAGYTTVEAKTGEEALVVVLREHPDLVILDVVMPGLSGLETCRLLKAQVQAFLPVLMLSSRNTPQARVEGLRTGADDYLGKPYNPEELLARVETQLRPRTASVRLRPASPSPSTPPPNAILQVAEFVERCESQFRRSERENDPLACLSIELDQYGDLVRVAPARSAEVIERLGRLIYKSLRDVDLIGQASDRRYTIVLPGTHFPGALSVAERVWRGAQQLATLEGRATTVSVGVSFYPNRDVSSSAELIRLAEVALEHAHRQGGGQICLFQQQGYLYTPKG